MVIQGATVWITLSYLLASAVTLSIVKSQRSGKCPLHALLWLNFLGASGAMLLVTRFQSFFLAFNPLGQNRVEMFSILLLVALFSLVVEIPGYLLNSKFDRATIRIIDDVADALLELRLNPALGTDALQGLLTTHRDELRELGIWSRLEKMTSFFKRMGNVDTSLLESALTEARNARAEVDTRSKHPLPTLIQVFCLSGLAFVLGEILATLRGK
jgi:hypothetical protein